MAPLPVPIKRLTQSTGSACCAAAMVVQSTINAIKRNVLNAKPLEISEIRFPVCCNLCADCRVFIAKPFQWVFNQVHFISAYIWKAQDSPQRSGKSDAKRTSQRKIRSARQLFACS